jgi:hypothetical protein
VPSACCNPEQIQPKRLHLCLPGRQRQAGPPLPSGAVRIPLAPIGGFEAHALPQVGGRTSDVLIPWLVRFGAGAGAQLGAQENGGRDFGSARGGARPPPRGPGNSHAADGARKGPRAADGL